MIKRKVRKALARVNGEVADMTSEGGLYARGLASEGYAGGYAQALRDVLLALDGVKPGTRHYWKDWPETKEDSDA